MAVPSKPAGGTPTPPLKLLPAPQTVKRSLATFKDIFTSVVETPIEVSRDFHQRNTHNHITSHPAGENSSKTYRKTHNSTLGGDVNESRNSQDNLETLQDDRDAQSGNA